MLVMCTSTSGASRPASASRRATEVCDQPPGLISTGSPASDAAWTQRSISPSSSVWRTRTSMSISRAVTPISSTSSAYVVVPYLSGSRRPSRPRFGPFRTWIVIGLLVRGGEAGGARGDSGPGGVEPGLVGIGQDRGVAQPVQHDEAQRRAAGLLVHPHDRLQPRPVTGVAGGQPHGADAPAAPARAGTRA